MNNSKLLIRTRAAARGVTPKGVAPEAVIPLDNSDPVTITDSPNADLKPWDQAHLAYQQDSDITFAEPDVASSSDYLPLTEDIEKVSQAAKGATPKEEYGSFMDYWPHPAKPSIWHLDDDYSQLRKAREHVKALPNKAVVRIAHFDTGYDPDHVSFPASLIRKDLQRNFVEGEEDRGNDASDTFDTGILKMPGHGTGTLSILAGTKVAMPEIGFDDFLGLNDSVEIVPIRLAKSVVLLKSGAFVKALDYVLNELHDDPSTRIHVITMSMGGVAARAWADMVNEAYEKGIFIVTAAGNNFMKLPSRTLIYPARFHRVVAACGVTYDGSPYHKPKSDDSLKIMEGNYGPNALMHAAIAAYTPNVPWATYRFNDTVGIRGDGTSSATPQIASAAALYYSKYHAELDALPEPWMKVEAIRAAMFQSARKSITGYDNDYATYYGNGILQAADMLDIAPAAPAATSKQKEDTVSFPFFRMILGTRGLAPQAVAPDAEKNEMLDTELMQLVMSSPELQDLLKNEEMDLSDLSPAELTAFINAVLRNRDASDTLKRNLLDLQPKL